MPTIKKIPGYVGYYADKKGNIWSRRTPGHTKIEPNKTLKKLTPTKNKGYYKIGLSKDCKVYTKHIHRLVLETFVGPCPRGMECCHNDGVRTNNNLSNLRWDTRKANSQDATKHGTATIFRKGENNQKSKLNNLQVRIIKKYPQYRGCLRHLSEYFGVAHQTIWVIRIGKGWVHK